MNATPVRHIPRIFGRRRPWLSPALTAGLVLALLISGQAHRAAADTTPSTCAINGLLLSPCPVSATGTLPPDLLNASQLSQGLYAATPAQAQSLQNLEQAAVSNTLADHGLPASDATAAQSWGRNDAEAELWALLVQAIETPPISRTQDMANTVAWLQAVEQRQAVQAANDAGLEYVKWAGLDQSQYQHLLATQATTDTLQSFFNVTPLNYNNPTNPGASTGGYCVYQPPAPYQNEYSDASNQSCVTPCTSSAGCIPTGPTIDQFVKWGAADADYAAFNSSDFAQTAKDIGIGVGVGAGIAVGVTGLVIASALGGVGTPAGVVGLTILLPFAALALTVAAVAALIVIVIAAIAIGVVDAINIFNAAAVPGQLASLIASAPTTTPDLGAMLNDPTRAQGLYSLFVGATLPSPRATSCDNSLLINQTGTITQTGITAPCLNAPDIPASANSDPAFAIQARGATTTTDSASLTWADTTTGITHTARLSGHWFIDHLTNPDGTTAVTQTLRMHYTDWSGQGQTAWLLGDPINGYKFLGIADLSASGKPLVPSTCLADQTCAYSSTIDYVGTDGHDYAASVIPSLAPTVAPSASSIPVEGSAVTFTANGNSPLGLPITYQWQFEQPQPGVIPVPVCDPSTGICTTPINYSTPVSGAQASYTWPTSGAYHVQLTATDSLGKQTVDTFTVWVADVPPTLALYPSAESEPGPLGCITLCDEHTVPLGSVTRLHGTITHTGSADIENVDITWGDGTPDDVGGIGSPSLIPCICALSLIAASNTQVSLADTHTYTAAGTYPVTVTVRDQSGATAVVTTTETVLRTPTAITLSSSANPAVSGQPITYTATISPTPDGGTVSFGGNDLVSFFCPSVPVNPATGTATCTGLNNNGLTPFVGTTAMTATYSGDANFEPSSAAVLTQTVNKADTAVTLTASANPVAPGQQVTYTATVGVRAPGSGSPTGTVKFLDGTASLCGDIQMDPSTATATCTATFTTAGNHAITAAYSPAFGSEQLFNPSTSAVLTQTVRKAATTLALAAAPNPAVYGQTVTLTATIGRAASGLGTPTGTVTFQDDGSAIAGCASQPLTPTTGTATCSTAVLGAGTHRLTASYSGDGTFAPSDDSATPDNLTVNPAPQAITFGPLSNHTLGDAPVTVSATGGGSGNPITFSAGPNSVCTAAGTNGATITLAGVGTCTVTANQAGNGNYLAAPPVAQSFTVSYPPLYLGTAVTSSPAGPITTGSIVTLTLTLGNHTTSAQTESVKVTLAYTGSHGTLSLTVPLTLKLNAGQTVSKSTSFTITKLFPRGTYTLTTTAKDSSGHTASSSMTLTVS